MGAFNRKRCDMAKKLILPVCIASIIAVLLTIVSDQRGFEELAKRADVAERATMPGTKCPLSREHVDQADITSLDICLRYGLKAYNAAQRYPASAVRVFAVYGEEGIFQKNRGVAPAISRSSHSPARAF